MFMILYSALLTATLILGAPWWLWRMATSGRYRAGLSGRLGNVPAGLKAVVAGKDVVWVHCVSVGEVLGAARLIAELQAALPGYVIAVSTTTQTGQEIARQKLPGHPVFYMPLDLAFIVRRYLNVLRPKLLVLMESELWPRLLVECERRQIPVAVVNARISDRSYPRYMKLRRLWRPLMAKVTLFLAQGEETAERLRTIGAPVERVQVSGNLKFDVREIAANAMTLRIGSVLGASRLMIAGSTLPGEEVILLKEWQRVLRGAPDAILLIAPRHPERFDEVFHLIGRSGFVCQRAKQLSAGAPLAPGSILLLDTLGDLASLYSKASVVFIGGSLVAKGGHNPLEAARFGVPVVMGRSYENFREIVEGMKKSGGIHILRAEEPLSSAFIEAPRYWGSMAKNGRRFYESQTGATGKTVTALLSLLAERHA